MILGGIIAIHFIIITGWLLIKKSRPAFTLLLSGICMFIIAAIINTKDSAQTFGFDQLYSIFDYTLSVFQSRLASTGLVIMLFGGYIEYMNKIKASDTFIFVTMLSLSVFKKYPQLFSIIMIPIGVLVYFTIPSATAMGLLLLTTIYPILLGLGVSKKSAITVICGCTIFDMGMASLNSNMAANLLNIDIKEYFSQQILLLAPLLVVLMVSTYFTNRYYDKKDSTSGNQIKPTSMNIDKWGTENSLLYSLFPVLPFIILLLLDNTSNVIQNVCIAIIISFIIVTIIDSIVKRSIFVGFKRTNSFWVGLGKMCTTVVVLIFCAEIFCQGLMKLGFFEAITSIAKVSFSKVGFLMSLGTISFLSTMIGGSNTALFSAISPLIPEMSQTLDIPAVALTLVIQLISGFARTVSPIAVVILTISEQTGVSPTEIAKRNFIPIVLVSITLIISVLIYYCI